MSALDDLLNVVRDESFTQDMFDLGEHAAAELTALRERLEKAERLLDEIMQRIEVWDGVPDKIEEWKNQ